MMKRKARGVEGGRGHSRHLKRGHLDSKHAPDSSRYFHFKSFEYLQNLPKLAKSRFVKGHSDIDRVVEHNVTEFQNFCDNWSKQPTDIANRPNSQAIRFFQLEVE